MAEGGRTGAKGLLPAPLPCSSVLFITRSSFAYDVPAVGFSSRTSERLRFLTDVRNGDEHRPELRARKRGVMRSASRFVFRHLRELVTNEYVELDPVILVPTTSDFRLHYDTLFLSRYAACNAGVYDNLKFKGATFAVLSQSSVRNSVKGGTNGSKNPPGYQTEGLLQRDSSIMNVPNKRRENDRAASGLEIEYVDKVNHISRQTRDNAAQRMSRIAEDLLDIEKDTSFFNVQAQTDNEVRTISSEQAMSIKLTDAVVSAENRNLATHMAQAQECTQVKNEKKEIRRDSLKPEKEKILQMGNNAIAGALAGVFVSLCLHPLDTIKTVIQSQNSGRQSLFPIVSSIVAARGVSGLYRGLGSNLASSAPISAIYTFTYESVKAALLPRLPQDYHPLAHCAAGGCASIATSLVYTPSERVKQQMQIGAVYRNSWLAFVGILQKGGLPALYSGWGAVLCRNVPQSVIKFFTYEGLKHWALCGYPPDTHLSNLQTLAFGGLAGSTAALFTTPFDVVKTRLQTQAVGSPHQYTSVLNALQKIAAEEGVRSLYRGLVPRLAIYVSQGALFFASYEFFKRALKVGVPDYRVTVTKQSEAPIKRADLVSSN